MRIRLGGSDIVRHGRRLWPLGALALAVVTVQPESAQEQPRFTSGTELVVLDVLVTDAHGKAVTGLTARDFHIVEKSHPQKIQAFSFLSVPPVPRAEAERAAAAPVRDVITNHVASHSRAFVVVIDDLHLLPQFQEHTRRVLTDVLMSIPTTDRVAVVFTGRSDLSIDFTDDRAAQIRAVGRIQNALAFAMDPSPVACGAKEVERRHQASGTLDVLRNVVTTLTQTHADERSVIYLSEGFNYDFTAEPVASSQKLKQLIDAPPNNCGPDGVPKVSLSASSLPGDPPENPADARGVQHDLKAIYDTAARADVRIYTIDPRGNLPLEAMFTGDVSVQLGGLDARSALQSKVRLENDFLRNVAEETGGLAEVTRSDLTGGVREILEDTDSYYLLGYWPDPLVRDGQYHEVKVTVDRPGLRVRARKGYDAPAAQPKTATLPEALAAGLAGGLPAEDLPLAAYVAPVAPSSKGVKVAVTVEVTYPGSTSAPFHIDDDLQYEVLDGDVEGKAKVVSRDAFHFAISPTRPGDIAFLIDDVIELAPGLANLRLGLTSKALGRVGTLAIPIVVPDPSKGTLQMLSLVLGVASPREAVMRPNTVAGVLPFQPTVSRAFSATDTLRLFAPLSWGSNDSAAAVTLTLAGPSGSTSKTLEATAVAPVGGVRRAAFEQQLPLADLKPGAYQLEVTARLASGASTTRAIAFEVHVP
jgi:VWFA-related protein